MTPPTCPTCGTCPGGGTCKCPDTRCPCWRPDLYRRSDLSEGTVAKGGQNRSYQIAKRPPDPPPMRGAAPTPTRDATPIAKPVPYGPVNFPRGWAIPFTEHRWETSMRFCDSIPDKMLAGHVRAIVSMAATVEYELHLALERESRALLAPAPPAPQATAGAVAASAGEYAPKGPRYRDPATGREMLVMEEPGHPCHGWLCWRHPDGAWVTDRKATADDLARLAPIPSVPSTPALVLGATPTPRETADLAEVEKLRDENRLLRARAEDAEARLLAAAKVSPMCAENTALRRRAEEAERRARFGDEKERELRGVTSEVFKALVRAGPGLGDLARVDLARAVASLSARVKVLEDHLGRLLDRLDATGWKPTAIPAASAWRAALLNGARAALAPSPAPTTPRKLTGIWCPCGDEIRADDVRCGNCYAGRHRVDCTCPGCRVLDAPAAGAPAPDRFDCLHGCGIGIAVDEDGCCVTCGHDAASFANHVPTYPASDDEVARDTATLPLLPPAAAPGPAAAVEKPR